MAVVSNVNRKAVATALIREVDQLKRLAGIAIQTHRAYESPGRNSQGLTQTDVAQQARTHQPVVSKLENGSEIPADPVLGRILKESGFDTGTGHGGDGLLRLLQALRDNEPAFKKIKAEKPA